ncbi:MAG: helix-turn-helix domain-containing protein [Candidatus Aminicenantes bacterium]|nr:helix-turn-helix domain-containing protein [Candidatus Aminicenantes bacterium]
MNKPKGYVSPLDRAKDPAVRRRIDEKKREIYLSTLLIEEMNNHKLSVRQLAERAKVSATTIQSIRAGEAENVGLAKLDHILSFVGRTIDFPPVDGATPRQRSQAAYR